MERRHFLKLGSLGSMGLYFSIETKIYNWIGIEKASFQPNRFLLFQKSGEITLFSTKTEMGQGTNTSIKLLAAEELCVSPEKIQMDMQSPNKDVFIATGGSWGMAGYYRQARPIFANIRQLFINAAATKWNISPQKCTIKNGTFIHPDQQQNLGYQDLLDIASTLDIPTNASPIPHNQYQFLGKNQPLAHLDQQLNGTAIYGIDQYIEGMLYASIEPCPVVGGKLESLDASAALRIPGVEKVIPLVGTNWEEYNYRPAGVAVLATNSWLAQEGRRNLKLKWSEGKTKKWSNKEIKKAFNQKIEQEGTVFRQTNQWAQTLDEADEIVEEIYQTPFWSHSPMEPMNTIAWYQANQCQIWSPCHAQTRLMNAAQKITGFNNSQIKIQTPFLGGSFGRRLLVDYAIEAILLSKKAQVPVQVLYSRIDETKRGHFMSAGVFRMQAIFKNQNPTAIGVRVAHISPWSQREPTMLKEGIDYSVSDDILRYPYEIPQQKYEHHLMDEVHIPVSWWRGTFANTAGFAMESWIDEIAIKANKDPLDFRLSLLENESEEYIVRGEERLEKKRFKHVLTTAKEKAGWSKKRKKRYGKGVAACFTFFESYAAMVAEVSVNKKQLIIHKIICIIDCGVAMNPNMIKAQIESGIIFTLSALFGSTITFSEGKVVENSFGDSPILTYQECPEIEVHILPSDEPASGVGELGNIPTFAAVCNAIFDACGVRVRELPLGDIFK